MIGNNSVSVSLILCTKNGGERLIRCLSHVDAITPRRDLEILIVDNGSTDGRSLSIAATFSRKTRHKCLVLQTSIPGNSAGRNVALEHAKGALILFIDDDCYPQREFVSLWIDNFRTNKSLGFASGAVRRFSDEQSKLGCNDSDTPEFTVPNGFVPRGLIQGSNMAFTRDCLDVSGKFDTLFGAGTQFAGEEWDLAVRASLSGWGGAYLPRPYVLHDHRRMEKEAYERTLFYDYGAGAVYSKHSPAPAEY